MSRTSNKLLTTYLSVSYSAVIGSFFWLVSVNERNPDGSRESDVAVLMPPVLLLVILVGQMFVALSFYLMIKSPEIEFPGCNPLNDRNHPNLTRFVLTAPLVLGVAMILWAAIKWTTM
jgi:hypothetical protein